jgi:stage V sporulation protein R
MGEKPYSCRKCKLSASEFIEFADKHAGVMQMSKQNINPYKIGIEPDWST